MDLTNTLHILPICSAEVAPNYSNTLPHAPPKETPVMEEMRVGRYYHPESKTEWQVVEWGKDGSHLKNNDEFRLTRSGLQGSQLTTFAITYPNGKVKHLTFSGYLPTDLDDLYDYWADGESI